MAKGYLYDNGDELITREDVNEVPDSSTAHSGDVLELDSNKKPKWTAPESELPSTGSASVGDVLTLDSDKDPVWSAPSSSFSPKATFRVEARSTGLRFFINSLSGDSLTVNDLLGFADSDNQVIVELTKGTFNNTFSGLFQIALANISSTTVDIRIDRIMWIGTVSDSDRLIVTNGGTISSVEKTKTYFDAPGTGYTLTAVT